ILAAAAGSASAATSSRARSGARLMGRSYETTRFLATKIYNLRAAIGEHGDRHVVREGDWLGGRIAEEIGRGKHPIMLVEEEGTHPIELAPTEVEHAAISRDGPAHGSHADVCEVARRLQGQLPVGKVIGVDPPVLELDTEQGRVAQQQ